IVGALKITLTADEDRKLAERPIKDPTAYQYFQRARRDFYGFSGDGLVRVRSLAEHGLGLTGPNEVFFGLLGLAEVWSAAIEGQPAEAAFGRAEEWAQRAFRLNPNSVQGNMVLGMIAYKRGQARQAAHFLERAISIDPSNVDALVWLTQPYLLAGRLDKMQAT